MCGRFTLSSSKTELQDLLPLFEVPEVEPRYNIAPTQPILAARINAETGNREVTFLSWGLVPSWAEDRKIGNRLINARGDTVASKPAFRAAFKRRRCLIPTSGFYEWKKIDKQKQPYFIFRKDKKPFTFAGLWEYWEHEGNVLESCTIITTEANDLMKPLHDRMPVIVAPEDFEQWLDPNHQTGTGLTDLIKPYPAGEMACFPVTSHVNNSRHEDETCIEPKNE